MVARSYVNLLLGAQPEYRTLGVHPGCVAFEDYDLRQLDHWISARPRYSLATSR